MLVEDAYGGFPGSGCGVVMLQEKREKWMRERARQRSTAAGRVDGRKDPGVAGGRAVEANLHTLPERSTANEAGREVGR